MRDTIAKRSIGQYRSGTINQCKPNSFPLTISWQIATVWVATCPAIPIHHFVEVNVGLKEMINRYYKALMRWHLRIYNELLGLRIKSRCCFKPTQKRAMPQL